jgi:nickel-dependent lactate racemase
MVDFGMTSRGKPVSVNAVFSESVLKLVIGQIDPHQFVGFTGRAKGAVIGCGAAKTIEGNHSLMFDERAWVGRIEGNPVREDIDEAGRAQETINQWIERFPDKPRAAVITNAKTTYFYNGQNNNSEKYSKT